MKKKSFFDMLDEWEEPTAKSWQQILVNVFMGIILFGTWICMMWAYSIFH